MERLTEKLTDKSYCISDIRTIRKECFYEDMECRHGVSLYTGKAIDKLGEYEDLEEQGKLLKLPCAVGDTVYSATVYNGVCEHEIRKFQFDKNGCCACSNLRFPISYFGKTVFLTREEAEAALKELYGVESVGGKRDREGKDDGE